MVSEGRVGAESDQALPPLLVIVGPTGVGKTAVALKLAAALPLEVVNADSRQVYRGMDIGTGKPTAEEQAAVPHHLIDVVDPDQPYHVARFRADALAAIYDIRRRGRLAAVVGGTGLYVRALLKGLSPGPPADAALRAELESYAAGSGPAALHARLAVLDPESARRLHANDRVRIIRALEIGLRGGTPDPVRAAAADWRRASSGTFRLLMVGLRRSREALAIRLAERARAMAARGMMEEVARLLAAGYDESLPAMGGIGYRQFCAVVSGRLTQPEALRLMIRDTVRYAKRQMTWFARDPEIRWIDVDAAGGLCGAADGILILIAREGLIG
jgi:tRNA dimethylallyltransferase